MTPSECLRHDNFACGRLSDSLLDSVNPGVLGLLSCCMYYEDALQQGIKKGQKWIYSNSSDYVPQSGTFDEMVASGMWGVNCAMPQAWAFIDLGVVHNGKHIYGDKTGGMAKFDTLGKYIGAVCELKVWNGAVKFRELYEKNLVKPGDIFLTTGHTFIYMGDELFMAAGHDGKWHVDEEVRTDDRRKAVFDSWVRGINECSNSNCAIYWQIRFKDNYIPEFYRNKKGEPVKNPAYDPATSITYKEGISPDVPAVEIMAEKAE